MSPRTGRPPKRGIARLTRMTFKLTEQDAEDIQYCADKLNTSRTNVILRGIQLLKEKLDKEDDSNMVNTEREAYLEKLREDYRNQLESQRDNYIQQGLNEADENGYIEEKLSEYEDRLTEEKDDYIEERLSDSNYIDTRLSEYEDELREKVDQRIPEEDLDDYIESELEKARAELEKQFEQELCEECDKYLAEKMETAREDLESEIKQELNKKYDEYIEAELSKIKM